jgi:hypothetical protein
LLNITDDELNQAISKRQSPFIPISAKFMDKMIKNEYEKTRVEILNWYNMRILARKNDNVMR